MVVDGDRSTLGKTGAWQTGRNRTLPASGSLTGADGRSAWMLFSSMVFLLGAGMIVHNHVVPSLAGHDFVLNAYTSNGQYLEPSVMARADGWRTVLTKTEEVVRPVRGENYRLDLGDEVMIKFVWLETLEAWVGKYEVTNGEFRRFRPDHDSGNFRGHTLNEDRQPVVWIDYEDAVQFARWLSEREPLQKSGISARLLNGDEWTAIARCGTNREFPWGASWPPAQGNYADETAARQFPGWWILGGYDDGHAVAAPVDQSGRNEWGLYGVGGNVWEWTSEKKGSSRVARGAAWDVEARDQLRVENRVTFDSEHRYGTIGFRVLLSESRRTAGN